MVWLSFVSFNFDFFLCANANVTFVKEKPLVKISAYSKLMNQCICYKQIGFVIVAVWYVEI